MKVMINMWLTENIYTELSENIYTEYIYIVCIELQKPNTEANKDEVMHKWKYL